MFGATAIQQPTSPLQAHALAPAQYAVIDIETGDADEAAVEAAPRGPAHRDLHLLRRRCEHHRCRVHINDQHRLRPGVIAMKYRDATEPELGDQVDVYSDDGYEQPCRAVVIRVGKHNIRVQWMADLITGQREWIMPDTCELITREFS